MAGIVPNSDRIKSFRNEAAFERWLRANHARETELWLKIYKKDSGVATVTYAQALDVALCWGWIDGLKKSFDEESFLQRFTPRKAKSVWSRINRDHVAEALANMAKIDIRSRHGRPLRESKVSARPSASAKTATNIDPRMSSAASALIF